MAKRQRRAASMAMASIAAACLLSAVSMVAWIGTLFGSPSTESGTFVPCAVAQEWGHDRPLYDDDAFAVY